MYRCRHGSTDENIAVDLRSVRRDLEYCQGRLRAAILNAAVNRQMTWYSQVAAAVTAVHVEPYSSLMNHLLGAILEDEHEAGRPLLTAIVTHKNGDLEPGPGFYEMARSLGYRFGKPYVFWSTQVQDIFTRCVRSRTRRS
jgi:hypothetical protein